MPTHHGSDASSSPSQPLTPSSPSLHQNHPPRYSSFSPPDRPNFGSGTQHDSLQSSSRSSLDQGQGQYYQAEYYRDQSSHDPPVHATDRQASSSPAYVPQYAARAHSYYPGDPSSRLHMQSRFDSDLERQQLHHQQRLFEARNRYHQQPKPLIHYVTNEWQNQENPHYRDYHDDHSDDEFGYPIPPKEPWLPDEIVPQLPSFHIPRRVQRWLLIYFIFLMLCWFVWLFWIAPTIEDEQRLDQAFAAAEKKGNKFGSNIKPNFIDMPQVETLPEHLIPGPGRTDRRLIFIGDVHGCKDELIKLLDKVSFNSEKDHVIFTGDIIAKGPDSVGVVDLARELNASSVRGNHEDRMLLAWQSLHSKLHRIPYDAADEDEDQDTSDSKKDKKGKPPSSRGDHRERKLARKFSQEQISFLQTFPVILHIPLPRGFSSSAGEYLVVHAGLVPGVSTERQDPFQAMNMRSIDLVSQVPSELRVFEPWERVWGHAMGHVHPAGERAVVIYGHDSRRGLNVRKYTKGLDSGCVRGGKLSALIVDAAGREKVVSVRCAAHQTGGVDP